MLLALKLTTLAFAVEERPWHVVAAEEECPFEGAAAVGLVSAFDVDAEPEAVETLCGAAEVMDAQPLTVGCGFAGDGDTKFLLAVAVVANTEARREAVALGDFGGEAEGVGLVHRSLSEPFGSIGLSGVAVVSWGITQVQLRRSISNTVDWESAAFAIAHAG